MNNHKDYTTNLSKRARILLIVLLALIVVAGTIFMAAVSANMAYSEAKLVRCWILCKPGSQVVVRRTPSKGAMEVGQLEVGDWFETDAVSSNGYIRTYGIGEYGEGWVYCGYVSTEEPVPVYETYCCVAKSRVACRRWMDGPQTENPWLKNGSTVQVFYRTSEWSVTNRGYIRSEWLEADPQ